MGSFGKSGSPARIPSRAVSPVRRRRSRLRVLPDRRREDRRGGDRRPGLRDRAVSGGGRAARRAHRARARDAHPRRPRLRARAARARARRRASRRTRRASPSTRSTRSPTATSSELGAVAIRVLHTPGHRPEHCCFAVIDRSRGDDPWLVITGDSLLVGSAARPGSRRRGGRGRPRPAPVAALAARARRRRRGLPGPRGRLALRRADELEGLDHDRLRAALQRRRDDATRTSSWPRRAPPPRPGRRTWSGSSR